MRFCGEDGALLGASGERGGLIGCCDGSILEDERFLPSFSFFNTINNVSSCSFVIDAPSWRARMGAGSDEDGGTIRLLRSDRDEEEEEEERRSFPGAAVI